MGGGGSLVRQLKNNKKNLVLWKENTTLNETEFTKLANHQAISDKVHGTERVGILLYSQTQNLARIQVFC